MKRNPLWDAHAKQYIASGAPQAGAPMAAEVPNALANQAMPGAGFNKRAALAQAMAQKQEQARRAQMMAAQQQQQGPPPQEMPQGPGPQEMAPMMGQPGMPGGAPLEPKPMPPQAMPPDAGPQQQGPPPPGMAGWMGVAGAGADMAGQMMGGRAAPGGPLVQKQPVDPRREEIMRRQQTANQGTPFQYRVSRGVR